MAGSTGDSGERKSDGFTTQLFILSATVATTIASGVGNIIASDFQHRQPLMFALLGAVVVVLSGWYVLRQRRSRQAALAATATSEPAPRQWPRILSPTGDEPVPAGPPAAPASGSPARNWVIAIMCALVAAAFFAGYWTIGNGFAHSNALGWLALAGVLGCVAAAMTVGWLCRRRRWAAWLLPGSRLAMACTVAALGLSAGGTLGTLDLEPPCPVPTELRVLSSLESLAGVQNAITQFEKDERSTVHQGCYAVDLTAFTAPSDSAAEADLESGWGASALSSAGPRPDIWIPASAMDVSSVSAAVADSGALVPQLGPALSVASSPVVVAVPNSLITQDSIHESDRYGNLGQIYQLLASKDIRLGVPSPQLSATGRLGIARLYGDLPRGTERTIEASGDFPADSGTLLCAAAQAAQQAQATGQQPPDTGYLVSAAAVNLSNDGLLTEGACPTLAAPPPQLTALPPADAVSLDFPFTAVNWGDGDPAIQQERQRHALDFYNWLITPAGQAALASGGLGPRLQRPAALPAVGSALERFTAAQAPAHILVAIDDSGPMEPYLPQIEAATAGALSTATAPGTQGTRPRSSAETDGGSLGGRDSVGVWAFPGSRATHAELVPFGRATAARLGSVAGSVSRLRAHEHSAQFDLLTEAAALLYGKQAGSSGGAIDSVVLLTDGDSQAQDPRSSNFGNVTRTALRPPGLPAQSRVKVFVIAFGAAGCTQTATSAAQSLEALATTTGGSCVNASGDLTRQLSLLISQLAGG
jgi:hypothetical protein